MPRYKMRVEMSVFATVFVDAKDKRLAELEVLTFNKMDDLNVDAKTATVMAVVDDSVEEV